MNIVRRNEIRELLYRGTKVFPERAGAHRWILRSGKASYDSKRDDASLTPGGALEFLEMPIPLDVRTLLLAAALISGAMAPLMYLNIRARGAVPGWGMWTASAVLFCLSFSLMAMGGVVSELISAGLSSLLLALAMWFASAGARMCCGRARRARQLEAWSVGLLCLQMYCLLVLNNPMAGLLINSLLLIFVGISTALPLLREAPEGRTFAYRYTAIVFLCCPGVPGLIFGVVSRRAPVGASALFDNTMASVLFCLSSLLFLVGLAFGYFLLTNDRLLAELRLANSLLRDDAEERLLMQEQLARSQRMEAIGRLAGGISHIFNNQMCIIQLHCEHLLGSVEVPDSVRPALRRIANAGERSSEITARLMQFARSNPLRNSTFDMVRWLDSISGDLKRVLGKSIELQIASTSPEANVLADADQLAGVLLALARNARHAMPSGGKWTLLIEPIRLDDPGSAREVSLPRGEYIRLSATDTGCGMDDETAKRIFEPFYSTKSLVEAEGLGLASAFGLLQQSGGTMSAESKVGAGSTIRLYLPKAASVQQ